MKPFKKMVSAHEDLGEAQTLLSANYPDGTCNRAYYSLFHTILALLHFTNHPIPKTHTGAHTEFRRQFIKTGLFAESISVAISELFNLRQGGDYEIDFEITLDDAQSAVHQAADFLLRTEAYLRENGFPL
ncbi:HEPN domain-containing protein [Spirosoma oryzicola]|uniref:HEPN domain-containing protein n=1 Tax=Spirosoma oryzicola TaxID=2898794 RepID=UPI001E446FB4|nr:HEPN domain-containing protein [Spirosoma oryzicola]UHG92033.1 HEPN domain-containing protein [Spirosoma oryzicola]